jgi:membrane fusion protein (multidrug efflux system)
MIRADFPNPDRVLRHGQTGTVLLHEIVKDALVIPQRATFEILDRVYVFVIGEDQVVRQREIELDHELNDVFVVGKGLAPNDRIVLDGVSLLHDGDKVKQPEFREPAEVLEHLKFRAE